MISLRCQKILDTLAGREVITVRELSDLLSVTEVTIRSDLDTLAKLGKISRTHGGARLVEERARQEYTFQTRKSLNSHLKHRIGEAAARLVGSLESVLLDSSTTALALAHALRARGDLKDVTVIPTGIWTAIELMGCQNINVLLPAGYLRHASGSIAGLPTQGFFDELNIQKAFLGAWGISLENGLTDTHLLEIDLKKRIAAKVRDIIVLADGSKFYQTGLASYASLTQVKQIITDSTAPAGVLAQIERLGVEITVVN
ncbi:MAG TPA: DeoR/GlpR family DNA-binding transcription regulator [Bacteroidota bacterium]|nr:DeoR/GlpR family DNA-binding transcription regulator [Bacteroidota bacterium]